VAASYSGTDYRIFYGTFPGFASQIVLSPVPEPATILGLAAGAGLVGMVRRRRRGA
jgi:hypothetical protein